MTVTEADTSIAFGSGGVPVLATPRLLALCEEASFRAVEDRLDDGNTTVGMRVQMDHLTPTTVDTEVTAEASLDKVEGRRLTFTFSARDPRGLIAVGKVTRVIVHVDRFMEKAAG